MINEIKELRVKIDGLSQLTKELQPFEYKLNSKELELANSLREEDNGILTESVSKYNSKEIDKAYDSLILSKAWLGKLLGELGAENPYKSGYKTKEDIEPTAEKDNPKEWHLENHIEKVDWLRQKIEILIEQITKLKSELSDSTFNVFNEKEKAIKAAIASTNSYNCLCEAKFWLGFELQRIKEND